MVDVRDAAVAHLASLPQHLKERYSAELIRRMLYEIDRLDELRSMDGESMGLLLKECQDYKDRMVNGTNHDAAPAARANAESVAPQPTAGDRSGNPTSHSGTGKQPAPPSVETDGFSSSSSSDPINRNAERESPRRECGESSLRDVARPDTKGKATGGPEPSFSDRSKPIKDDDSDRSKPISDNRLSALEELSAMDQELELKHGITGNPMIKARQRTPPQGSVQGEGSFRDSRNAKEPVAWHIIGAEYDTGCEYEYATIERGMAEAATAEGCAVVPLYRSPALTDEEREAIAYGIACVTTDKHAAALRKLLERLT